MATTYDDVMAAYTRLGRAIQTLHVARNLARLDSDKRADAMIALEAAESSLSSRIKNWVLER